MNFKLKKSGFTLSEIMVTLALVGSLATLTLATIGSSIQQRARLSEFRAAFARMEATLRSIEFDRGSIYACYTNEIGDEDKKDFEWNINGRPSHANNECAKFLKDFTRAMGATHICESNPVTEGCFPANYPPNKSGCWNYQQSKRAYVFDNSMILMTYYDPSGQWFPVRFAIDVNGRKGPNKWGQDLFPFSLTPTETQTINGTVYVKQVNFTALQNTANDATCYAQGSGKTTREMLKESAGLK